jgi:tripartite-type tricarboxylate transporter receptor subunit TctC
VLRALESQSFTPISGTPEQLRALIDEESARYGPLIEKLGLHAE